jgi:SulP family sulfate permease
MDRPPHADTSRANSQEGRQRSTGSTREGTPHRPVAADLSAGLITAVFSIPEGMAYATIAGFNPVAGLYAGVVPAVLGSTFARTALMVTTLTSAIAITAHRVLLDAHLDPTDPANIAALTLAVGIAMALFAAVRLGSLLRLISPGVMTGFSLAIAVRIIAGSLAHATGYHPARHASRLLRIADWAAHAGSWAAAPTAVACTTVVVWGLSHMVRRLRSYSVLISLTAVSSAVAACHPAVALAGSLGAIPAALPSLSLPAWKAIPHLATGAGAVALVALAQAAGIPATIPAPGGRRAAVTRDIVGQAVANIGGAFFQALPAGGSLSRTAVALTAGGRTRWTGILSGAFLALLVCASAPLVARIPLPAIGALLAVIGAELITGRATAVRRVWRRGRLETLVIITTFLTATQIPLHYAIAVGLLLSLAVRTGRTAAHRVRAGGRTAPKDTAAAALPHARTTAAPEAPSTATNQPKPKPHRKPTRRIVSPRQPGRSARHRPHRPRR